MERDHATTRQSRALPTSELVGYYSNDAGTLTAHLVVSMDHGDDTLMASGTTCGFTPCIAGCACPYGGEYYTRTDPSTNTFVPRGGLPDGRGGWKGEGATGKLIFREDKSGFDWPGMTDTFMYRRR